MPTPSGIRGRRRRFGSAPLPGDGGAPAGFWDPSNIPAAKNVMMFKFLNRTNGKYADSEVYWSFKNGNISETHSIADEPTYDMPANNSGRMYFYLCATGDATCASDPTKSKYYDFIEHTIGATQYNGNTTRVDAFGIRNRDAPALRQRRRAHRRRELRDLPRGPRRHLPGLRQRSAARVPGARAGPVRPVPHRPAGDRQLQDRGRQRRLLRLVRRLRSGRRTASRSRSPAPTAAASVPTRTSRQPFTGTSAPRQEPSARTARSSRRLCGPTRARSTRPPR